MGNTVGGLHNVPCLTRIKTVGMSTPIQGGMLANEEDESFISDMYKEYVEWFKSYLKNPDVCQLENENRHLRRRIDQLETEMEWSRMDAIESHYRTVGAKRKPEKGSTSISMLNLSGSSSSDDEEMVRFIPHKDQVCGGRGDVKLLLHVGIGSVGEQSTSILASAPDKENMIPRN
jgi:hypothetical protein